MLDTEGEFSRSSFRGAEIMPFPTLNCPPPDQIYVFRRVACTTGFFSYINSENTSTYNNHDDSYTNLIFLAQFDQVTLR